MDYDGDGYGNEGFVRIACSQPELYVQNSDDCDDADFDISPQGLEMCDGIDNDCDDEIDENPTDALVFYFDGDQDGYGQDDQIFTGCVVPDGYVHCQ